MKGKMRYTRCPECDWLVSIEGLCACVSTEEQREHTRKNWDKITDLLHDLTLMFYTSGNSKGLEPNEAQEEVLRVVGKAISDAKKVCETNIAWYIINDPTIFFRNALSGGEDDGEE